MNQIAKAAIDRIGALKPIAGQLERGKKNMWCPPPRTKVIKSTKTVHKINDDIEETEFQVEIPYSESLAAVNPKSVKVKINDKDGKELIGHYFDAMQSDDTKATLTMPTEIQGKFKNQNLHVAVKDKLNLFFEKNIFRTDFSMSAFNNNNQITKSFKFDKVKFDVIVRIKQAYKGLEMTQEETTKIEFLEIPEAFDLFSASKPQPEAAAPVAKPQPQKQVQMPQEEELKVSSSVNSSRPMQNL